MKTAGPYNNPYETSSLFYRNIHDWISRCFFSTKPRIITTFWVSFGVFVWIMLVLVPLALSE